MGYKITQGSPGVSSPATVNDNSVPTWDGTKNKLQDQNAMFITDADDVGIGTSTPDAKTEILDTGEQLRLTHTDATDYAKFEVDGDGQTNITTVDGGGAGGHICFMPDGNVGIGTTGPGAKLDIQETGSTNTMAGISQTGTGYAMFALDASDGDFNGADYLFLRHNNDLTADIHTGVSGGNITLGAAQDDTLILTTSGNVGIGTTSPGGLLDVAPGTTGGLYTDAAEATANIEGDSSTTIQVNVPSGAKILGCQLRVDAALAAGETWDAAYSGGASQSIASGQAVAQNTKVNKFFDENAATAITSGETDIDITKNGGGSFTAQGTIRAIVYYQAFTAMADAS